MFEGHRRAKKVWSSWASMRDFESRGGSDDSKVIKVRKFRGVR